MLLQIKTILKNIKNLKIYIKKYQKISNINRIILEKT